jgi:hypothetical protein
MISTRPLRAAAATAALVGGLALTLAGCTAVGPDAARSSSAAAPAAPASSAAAAPAAGSSSQSKAQACQILTSSLKDVSTRMTSSYQTLAKDPKAAAAVLDELSSTLDGAVKKVSNVDVRSTADTANTDLKAFVSTVKTAVADPSAASAAKVQSQAGKIQADFQKIGTACA